MVNKSNNKFIYAIGPLIMLLFVFAKCNYKSHPAINAYIEDHVDSWEKINSEIIDTSNVTKVKLQFLNNPYKFSNKNNLAIYIDKSLIYRGGFESIIDVYVPKKLFGDRALPSFSVYDSKRGYHFIHKKSIFLTNEDRYLYVVFCPENELVEGCYMFAQSEPIL